MITTASKVKELEYEAYVERQHEQTMPPSIKSSLDKLKRGNKFEFQEYWKGLDYEGYAVVSMLNQNPGNEKLQTFLDTIVVELSEVMNREGDFYFLPKESYHQTVANTLSSKRFYENVKDKGLEEQYPKLIQRAFEEIELDKLNHPIEMNITGLSVFGSSFGVLGTFNTKADFDRIIDFRDAFYDTSYLNDLDIKRTRPFIGHITLGYFENETMISDQNKSEIANVINRINQEIDEQALSFKISNTELRKYYDLSEFNTHDSFPKFSFIK